MVDVIDAELSELAARRTFSVQAYRDNGGHGYEAWDFIVEEVHKLVKAKVVREVLHPTWLANPVVVPKPNGKKRMCIDFIDLNKACPKDPFPSPRIDHIVDSTAGVRPVVFS